MPEWAIASIGVGGIIWLIVGIFIIATYADGNVSQVDQEIVGKSILWPLFGLKWLMYAIFLGFCALFS